MSSNLYNVESLSEYAFNHDDADAAWEVYVELSSRSVHTEMSEHDGVDAAILTSMASLFWESRSILRSYGKDCVLFADLMIATLNEVVRPFTSKWHPKVVSERGKVISWDHPEFRSDHRELQAKMRVVMANVRRISGVDWEEESDEQEEA